MAFDLCVIPVSTVPYLSALQTRQFSMTEITAHLVSEKLTRDQCRSMTPEIFASSYGSSSHALHVRSSVSSEINLAITSSVSVNAPSGYTIVIQGYLNDHNSQIVLGVCVSDEPIVADASLRLFMNIEETNNVFRFSADFYGMVTQGLLDDILARYVTTDTEQDITGEKIFTESSLKIGSDTIKHYSLKHGQEFIIGTQTASTNKWTGVSVQDSLYDGMCINFYLPYAGTSNAATLTLTMADGTTTAAIPIKYRGNNNVTTTFPVGSIIQLTYCENKVIGASTITGWLADSNYATSSPTIFYERNRLIGRVVAGSTGLYALQPSLLVDRDGNEYVSITTSSTAHASGTPKTCTTLGFYPESILTSDTSYESGNTANKIWRTYTLTVNQCFGTSSLTAYRPVYLVCTFNRNDGKFYLDTTQWWAQTIPQQENGKLYIFLGITATTTTFTLDSIHPILCYKNGRVQEVTYSSLVLGSAAFREAVDIMPDASSGELPSSVAIKSWVSGQIQDASDYIRSIIPSGDAADKNVDTSIVNESSENLPTVEAVTDWVSSQLNGYAQSSEIPTVGNATITIQKRSGTSAGNFTTNATANKTINLSLGAAADKEVDTSISSTSSTNLPTSSAVAEWVNAQTGNFVTLNTQQTITSTKTLRSGEYSTSLNISNIVVEHTPSSTSGHTSSVTLAPEGLYADGVSFTNAYGRAADNFLVASVSGNGGYSELTGLGGDGFTFCYKGTDETDYHYPLRLNAGITMFDENQTLYLAKDTNTYLHVNGTTVSVKDYVDHIACSGSSKFVVADVNTLEPSQISSLTDYRQSGTSSDNPHYNSTNASFKFDVSELPSNGTTFEVFLPLTSFVGSVQLVYGSSNYIYPIYFRGNDNVHCPTVPQGSVLRITFYNDAFYGDFYDLADFGDEHEAYVYVGKVPVDKYASDLYSFSGLVGIDRETGKFSQLFTVEDTPNGFFVQSPLLRENSPIYACFQGDCFAAHPKVPFGNILRIHDEYYVRDELQTGMLPFTYYPFDDGDTVDSHVVTNTSSQGAYKYFQVDNCPVYIQAESNSVLIGNPPADVPARLIGFMCSGAENAGMIRLVENADVSYMSDDDYSKTFAGVWDYNSVDSNTYFLSNVSTSLSYLSDNVLVGLSKNSSKLVPLLVDDACGGDVMINTNLDWDSPVYVLFKNFRCFSAHPLVDFRQVLKSDNGSFMFTFSPMGSETPFFTEGDDGNQYFGGANYPVFISDFSGSYAGYKSFCVGIPSDVNIPSSDLHWRLLGYTTSTPGYIRLTESHPFLKDFIHQTGGDVKLSDFDFTTTVYDASTGEAFTPSQFVEHLQSANTYGYDLNQAVYELVSRYGDTIFNIKDLDASSVYASESNGEVYVRLPSMTTVEFKDRVSFRTSTGEAAYIDSDGVYHGDATGIASTPSLSFSEATSGTTGGTLSVSVGNRTSLSVAISPVRRAYEATTLATARTVDGMLFNGSGNITHYGTCGSSAATVAKVVTLAGFELATGARIAVKFTYSNTATNPTLNVNGTGAKAICYRGTTAVSGTSNYYRWQANDVVEFIYDGTNWIIVGWQTYAYYAYSATSATSATYATNLRYSSTNVLTADSPNTVVSNVTIYPSTSGSVSLGSQFYKWNYVYCNYIGDSSNYVTSAYITNMYGTASNATADASGNTITSTYLRSISVGSSSTTFTTYTAAGTTSSASGYSYNTELTLTKNSTSTVDLTGLVASIIAGISGIGVGSIRWVCCKTTAAWSKKSSNIYMSGAILYPVDMITSASDSECIIRFNANTSINNSTMGNSTVPGVWRLLNYVGAISKGNMLVALAVRVY